MKRGHAIDEILRPLYVGSQAYISNVVQTADILEWILKQVGVSQVWQTTFSISEEFLRRLYNIRKSGLVSDYSLVLDLKATNKTLSLWPFITQALDHAYLSENHSKILLVRSSSGDTISVITSQNLTRGNRYEATFITTDSLIFSSLHSQLQDIIDNHSSQLNDLYRQRLDGD